MRKFVKNQKVLDTGSNRIIDHYETMFNYLFDQLTRKDFEDKYRGSHDCKQSGYFSSTQNTAYVNNQSPEDDKT